MICVREPCRNGVQNIIYLFISSTLCFVLFFIIIIFFFFQRCQKGNSLHDCKLKNTHECTTQMLTSKPVQGKQVYVGLHHLVQILYYNQTLCVCVYVYVLPRLKAWSKISFGATHSFFPSKFRNSTSQLIACIGKRKWVFFDVLFPSLTLLLVMVVIVPIVIVV